MEQIKNRASQIVQLKSQAQYYISNIRVQPERITLRETGTRGREKNKKKLTAMISIINKIKLPVNKNSDENYGNLFGFSTVVDIHIDNNLDKMAILYGKKTYIYKINGENS